ncbi:MAG: hypothetical protein M3016_09630, partial [Actinomycetota bacterium]|nr:hypothetical protein [Actinomycetota bacterium]
MRTTETDLNSFETQARDVPTPGREHNDAGQRPRARGEHAASANNANRRRQPRRRTGEHRAAGETRRAGSEATGLAENSLDLFLRAARAHSLLTAEEEVELAQRIERGDLA